MLNKKFVNNTIILASKSPRRHRILKDLGLDFVVKTKEIDEIYPLYLHGGEITDYLAKLKASAFYDELKENDILITADTIVRFNGKIIEKPKDSKEAKEMLAALSGYVHEVITSICITSVQKQVVFHDYTDVHFKKLSKEEIDYYVDNYKPFDKAGAYGIQEWLGYIAVTKVKGSYFNVMGFPVHKFYKEMIKF
tara:strand:- start:161746 stop:162327 length:582 start_codon:yes stop_codon:yes gene_type:complete